MRQRRCWIEGFMDFCTNTETPPLFAKWTAVSVIAGVLRKKCWFSLGRLRNFANLYIVLVGPPGVGKSVTIGYGKRFLEKISGIYIAPESTTREALFDAFRDSIKEYLLPDGSAMQSAAITVTSNELESFIGNKKENSKFLVSLTDLFDGVDVEWRHFTRNSGKCIIPNAFLNILGGTTPSSLASSLPADTIGGGLTARILFAYCEKKSKLVAIPEYSDSDIVLETQLLKDLMDIADLRGIYSFDADARRKYIEWYHHNSSADRVCKDVSFAYWYERKPLFVQKIAMILKASESSEKSIEWRYFEKSLAFLEELESSMGNAFRAVGRSDITHEQDLIKTVIKTRECIKEEELLSLTYRDVDYNKFQRIIDLLIRAGFIAISTRSKDGKPGIYYVWKKQP